MKNKLLASAILLFSSVCTRAQLTPGDFTFGAGLHLGLATGNLGTGWSLGIGAELQGEYAFTGQLSGVATTGYTAFLGKSVVLGAGEIYKYPSYSHIPVLVGARFYATGQIFVGGQIGLGVWTGSGGGGGTSGFEFRPEIGYNADLFQVILGYDDTSVVGAGELGYVGLTGIYKFGGGK